MSDKHSVPHFEGYWVTSPELWILPDGEPVPTVALMFFDKGLYVRFEKTPVSGSDNRKYDVKVELMSYVLIDDSFETTPASNTSSTADEDWSVFQWRITEDPMRPLEFSENGQWHPYVPATRAVFEEAGFPASLFGSWEETAKERGWHFAPKPRVPAGVERYLVRRT